MINKYKCEKDNQIECESNSCKENPLFFNNEGAYSTIIKDCVYYELDLGIFSDIILCEDCAKQLFDELKENIDLAVFK